MASNEEREKEIDKVESSRWAIAVLDSEGVGDFIGGSITTLDLVNLRTNRAHHLILTSFGFTIGPLPVSASLTASNYSSFTTPRPATFRSFDKQMAGIRSVSLAIRSYSELFIKDSMFGTGLVNVSIDGGWGYGTPGADGSFGVTSLVFGDGVPSDDVDLGAAYLDDTKSPEPIGLLDAKVSKEEVLFDLAGDALFAFGKWEINSAAKVLLKRTGEIIRSRPGNVSVIGHTDGIGNDRDNQILSEKRAQVVRQWLIDKKYVKAANVVAWGNASKFPVEDEKWPDGSDNPNARAKNRRVEIVIKKR